MRPLINKTVVDCIGSMVLDDDLSRVCLCLRKLANPGMKRAQPTFLRLYCFLRFSFIRNWCHSEHVLTN